MKCEVCKHDSFDLDVYIEGTKDLRESATLECRLCGTPVQVYGRMAKTMKLLSGLLHTSDPSDVHDDLCKIRDRLSDEFVDGKTSSSSLAEICDIIRHEDALTIEWMRSRYASTMKYRVNPLVKKESDRKYLESRNNARLDVMKEVANVLTSKD